MAESSNDPGDDCVLCPPLRFRFNYMAGLPGRTSVLAADRDFFVMPDLAPLADGHLLLVTDAHHLCAGVFCRRMWTRAREWRDRIARMYQVAYGNADLLMFEHGPAQTQGGGACIDHAHWHFLPGTPGIRAVLERDGTRGASAGLDAVRHRIRAGRSYLLVDENGRTTVHPGDGVPSQFLRWAASTAIERGPARTWRWQETFASSESKQSFLRTLDTLRRAVAAVQRSDNHQ